MLLSTRRFLLRDFIGDDRAAFVAYQRDPRYRVLYGLEDDGGTRAGELLDRFLAWQREEPRRNFQLGIVDQATRRLCGCAGLRREGQPEGRAVLGIELTPDDWGRYRLAWDVVAALLAFGFRDLGSTPSPEAPPAATGGSKSWPAGWGPRSSATARGRSGWPRRAGARSNGPLTVLPGSGRVNPRSRNSGTS